MNKPAKLTPTQIECLVSVWRTSMVGKVGPSVIKALEDRGLIRYTHNEFIFTFNGGSGNGGYIVTEQGLALANLHRPPCMDEVIAALSLTAPLSEQQKIVLQQLKFWRRVEPSTPTMTITARSKAISA